MPRQGAPHGKPGTLPLVRCAVYVRKSTEEGLQQEFNSLDAQREACEAYVKSQAGEGWVVVPERYSDGGYSGGNVDRPGLQRLLADIEAGRIDAVVVYKVDRLSRSLLDFARLMDLFEQRHVSFVSITQQFSTATSMGRLVMNVLLSFAQFEREIIAERTRDKVAATRRKGKWCGGVPVLGYDLDRQAGKLTLNDSEASQVQAIFHLYLEYQSLRPVLDELDRRGWTNKAHTTREGRTNGGQPFTKTSLHRLLCNPVYRGKTRYKAELHEGEHAAIVDQDLWDRVQDQLGRNRVAGGAEVRNSYAAILKGLLRCTACDSAMTPSHTKKGTRHYRYYTCTHAQKRGWDKCPAKSIPAGEIEALVLEHVRRIGADPTLRDATLAQATQQDQARQAELDAEKRGLQRDLQRYHTDLQKLTLQLSPTGDQASVIGRLADTQERIDTAEQRLAKVQKHLRELRRESLDAKAAVAALQAFEPVWQNLSPREKSRLVALLVQRVDYDATAGKVSITFYETAIRTLASEITGDEERTA